MEVQALRRLSMEFYDLSSCASHGFPRFKRVKHGIPWNSKPYVNKEWNSIIYISMQLNDFQTLPF